MPNYYLEDVDDQLWREWVNSFARDKAIDERLVELMRADAQGKVDV